MIHFSQPEHAASVQEQLQGHFLQGPNLHPQMVTATPAGLDNASQSRTVDASLHMWWSTGMSTGQGAVQFATAQAANDALDYIQDAPLNSQQLQVAADPELKLNKHRVQLELDSNGRYTGRTAAGVFSRGLPLRFPVKVTGLPSEVDEITLEKHFQTFGNVASAFVTRADADLTCDEDDAVRIATLNTLVPSLASVQAQADLPSQKHRSGKIIHYGSLHETTDAARQFQTSAAADPDAYSYLSQPVRPRPEFTCTVSFHKALFDSRPADFQAVAAWCIGHGIKCSIKDLPGKQPRKVFRLVCRDEAYLTDARRQLDCLLMCDLFCHPHGADLFTQHSRLHRLPQIVEKARTDGHATCYLHWDVSTRQIRVYGSTDDRAHLKDQLAALADELADLQSMEISLPFMKKRMCYRDLPKLGAIDGVAAVHIKG